MTIEQLRTTCKDILCYYGDAGTNSSLVARALLDTLDSPVNDPRVQALVKAVRPLVSGHGPDCKTPCCLKGNVVRALDNLEPEEERT